MSDIIAANAAQGVQQLVDDADRMLQQVVTQQRPGATFSYPNTVYYLPIILGYSAKAVERLGDLRAPLSEARRLMQGASLGLNASKNAGQAALLAAEIIEALRSPDGQFDSRITDTQVRSWGVQLADGRMPGVAVIMGRARNNDVAARLVEELRQYNVLCLLSGNSDGAGMWQQLEEEGLELDSQHGIVPLGKDSVSAVHAFGFAARCAMKLGGHKPGMWPEILSHSKRRVPGFLLALGPLEERDVAMALGAREFGFPLITDDEAPAAIAGTEQVYAMPFDSLEGKGDLEKTPRLVEKCMDVRGMKPRVFRVNIPVSYSPAFDEEVISDADVQVEFGGAGCSGFELVLKADPAKITDGKIEVIGPALPENGKRAHMDLGIVVKVAGDKVREDFEPYLEHQIHDFINYANGLHHEGRQDRITLRISKGAAAKGVNLESLGTILHARFHEEFGAAIEKVEIALITDPDRHAEWLQEARLAYKVRKERLESMTDDQVDVFYICTNCRTFAPNNVSIISPERVSPCGKCNWFDARAAYELNPVGARRPLSLGKVIDSRKGIWEGTNKYAQTASHGHMSEVAMYSIMQTPMGACGDFECMVVLIPEANGVMVLSHEDTSLPTPAGITIATFSSLTAGEQIPGVVGMGKNHLLSRKFLFPEGGFKRVVWMSSRLKESMAEELQAVCEREGDPTLMEKIADERHVTTVEQLVRWLREHKHPALDMERMF